MSFELGVGIREPLFFLGIIEDNDDPTLMGRVKVRAFSIHGTKAQVSTEDLPWAMVAHGNYDPNNFLPAINSYVYGMFLDGRAAQVPVVLGLLPTQFVEPIDDTVMGAIPKRDGKLLAKGHSPRDAGQAQMSRLARGENIEETGVASQEVNRIQGFKIGGTDKKWSEPQTAYATKYPHNRVIETVHHSIELDDTPGGERITIRHKEGSYVQIDSMGNVSEKSKGARHEVTTKNKYEGTAANHIVTIGGDAHVYVKGNKTEEIEGNYNLLVHGNAQFGVGGQMNLNGGDQIQMRAADVKIQANVGTMSILAEKELQVQGKQRVNVKGNNIYFHANLNPLSPLSGKFEVFADTSTTFFSGYNIHMRSSNMFVDCHGLIPALNGTGFNVRSTTGLFMESTAGPAHIKSNLQMSLQGLANVSIKGTSVFIDDLISMAMGLAIPAVSPGVPSFALPTINAAECQMPEPPSRSAALSYIKFENTQSTGGYISAEE